MAKKITILLIYIILLTGCADKEIITKIENKISIIYPVTNITTLDTKIKSYVNKIYKNFKKKKKTELNITYLYKELNKDIVNVSLNTEIVSKNKINKVKTFTYDKRRKKFLTISDIAENMDSFKYNIKKQIINNNKSLNLLNNIDYDSFSIDDKKLTLYFKQKDLKQEIIYLNIPLNSLKLLINIEKSKSNNLYLNLKKRNIDENKKVVALTFDDGPSKYTSKILDTLKSNNACGTFFVIDNKVDFYNKVLIRMLKEGSEIGNHSYSHKWLNRLSKDEFQEEINKTQNKIKKVTGFTPKLFRATYGGYNERLKSYTNLTFVLWDVDSRDWEVKNTNKILNNIMSNVKNESIILMHNNHDYALKSLDMVIKKLKKRGYEFVTVSELLQLENIKEN